jgi:thioesterase domain-containing protein
MTDSDLDELILRRLSAGDSDPILVADFQALSLAPRMSEMLSESIRDKPVFQIDPIGVLTGARLYASLPTLVEDCVEEFLKSGADHGHVFVVGHCSSSALALQVADRLAADRSVTAVLLQPAWPDDELVADKFTEYAGKFGKTARSCPDLNADPELVVAEMEQIFRDEMNALAASRDLTSSMGAFSDLLVWYRGWLAFLLACRNDTAAERTGGRAAVTVLSDSPSTVEVKGLDRTAYEVRELPAPQPSGPVTPELAGHVAAYLGSR